MLLLPDESELVGELGHSKLEATVLGGQTLPRRK